MKEDDVKEERMNGLDWHTKSSEEVKALLHTEDNGLTSAEARKRLADYGENVLPSEPPPSLTAIFFEQFASPLVYVLLFAAVVSFLLHEYTDAAFIFLVLFLNAVIGTYQEYNAAKSAAALQTIVPRQAVVIRDGQKMEIPVSQVVPGDLVILEAGISIPADLRLMTANSLEIDESLLTGESLSVHKNTASVAEEHVPLGDRTNMAFATTVVTRGTGTGIAAETGVRSEIGKIAKIVSTTDTKTPLVQRMEKFTRNIAMVILLAAAVLAVLAFNKGLALDDVFFMAVALAVSAIPEGLPIGITVALSIGMNRMARRNVIVRQLVALEGLGSCTVIASDKTGTLTHNQLTVRLITLPARHTYDVTGEGYNPAGEIKAADGKAAVLQGNDHLPRLVETGVLCNDAAFYEKGGQWHHFGDSVDVAFLVLGEKGGSENRAAAENLQQVGAVPFDAQYRYAAAFHSLGEEVRITAKGAYEAIITRCRDMLTENGLAPLDKELLEAEALRLAGQGYRVLALADGITGRKDSYTQDDVDNLTFLGLVGMIDPLRQEAKAAVHQCEQAGIKVCMVTGDHPLTALAIAKDLGIAKNQNDVVTGAELKACGDNEMSPEFMQFVGSKTVFARVEPFQKQLIIQALMKNGHFVAVTGDGVNDTPALKEAHIGVAMGSGTDIAKETADVVITDDNFASLVAGVEEGRVAYDNIRKIIYLLISTGFAEIILFTLSIVGGYPVPLLAVQILWLNLVTNGVQDVALAFEPNEGDVMERRPRPP